MRKVLTEKQKLKAAELKMTLSHLPISGFQYEMIQNMDPIADLFEGLKKGAVPIRGHTNNSLLDFQYGVWDSRADRKLYDFIPQEAEEAAGRKRNNEGEVMTMTMQRVEVDEFKFSDGFVNDDVREVLDDYEVDLPGMVSATGLRTTFDKKMGKDGAFDKMLQNKYFSLACAMCHKNGFLTMVLDLKGDFRVHLENFTKKKMPARK